MSSSPQETYMMRAVKVSLFGNVILFSIKLATILLVNSLAIAVDLGISCVGLAVSIILYHSIKMANRPEDQFHNYGYSKVEHVCEAMEGVILIGIALAMSFQAGLSLFHPRHIGLFWVGLTSSIVNFSINFVGAYFIFEMAQKSASPAIHAEGVHYRLEGFISMTVAASFIVSIILRANNMLAAVPYVDPVATLLVSVIIAVPSFKMAKGAFFNLLDATIEEGSKMEVVKWLARHSEKYCDFGGLKSRVAGRKKFIELEIILPEDIHFRKGHNLITGLEADILSSVPGSVVNIKMKPCDKDCEFLKKSGVCPYLSAFVEEGPNDCRN